MHDGTVDGWFGFYNGEGYSSTSADRYSFGANGEAIFNYAPHDDEVMLEAVFSAHDDLLVDWQVASILADHVGGVVDLYLVVTGDCSFLSTTCDPRLLAQYPDGSVESFTPSFGWAGR